MYLSLWQSFKCREKLADEIGFLKVSLQWRHSLSTSFLCVFDFAFSDSDIVNMLYNDAKSSMYLALRMLLASLESLKK